MSDEITAAAKAEIARVGQQAGDAIRAGHDASAKALGNVERAAHEQLARAKGGDKASIVTIVIVAIAVAGLVYGLVHTVH